ncbi:MAG TPA: VOC family protein [Caulobacteraceae bacterium]|jgi:catechol 2,3-dioxygenase-like lactoylglutathione lyase family enzyme|nr:VOC family protein [Caulobacteraceae bacterium]
MLDHVSVGVSDFQRARAFYDTALGPLGLKALMGGEGFAGYGDDRPFFWIGGGRGAIQTSTHIAFSAADRSTVDAFYEAALAAGGADNGAPGVRAHYHPNYYGAFVLDPDGHNVEAVCHLPA